MSENKAVFSGFTIKMIAVVTMLIDHIGAVLFPEVTVLRIIGRIAFPLFCFLLVEGFFHTKNVRQYLFRLFLFALISEIPFDLAFSGTWFDPSGQNVFWTLFLGLLMLLLMQNVREKHEALIWPVLLIFSAAAQLLEVDYHLGGILILFLFYYFRDRPLPKYILYVLVLIFFYGGIEPWAVISILPMLFYSGAKGPSAKWVFYLFYPCHILLLYLVSLLI